MGLAALLTLAFVLVWPPVDYGSGTAQAGTHDDHTRAEQNGQHSLLNVKMGADCDAMAPGCCMMAHCCQGLSVGPHDLPGFAGDDGTTAASAVRGTGSDPGMVPPPPRHMPV